jgi:hypothetical protein
MSTELGQLFQDGLTYSAAIFDAKSIVVMSGSYISAIPQTVEFGAARALTSTGGLRKDELYWPNAERDKLIPAHWSHKHQTGDAWNGGSHQAILLANMKEWYTNLLGATPEMYYSNVSGSGYVSRHSTDASIRVGSGGTANSWSRLFRGGASLAFNNKILFRTKIRVNDDLAQLVRWGINMENPANAADNLEKFGCEGCDGDGPNYRLVTANGVNRHKEPTPFAIEQTSFRGFSLLCEPGTTVTIQYDDGTDIAETNNIPSTSSADSNNGIKLGIKTTNSNDKILTLSGLEAFGISGDSDWFQMFVVA